MPDQPRSNFPILGFVAGTPNLMADGLKRIEDIKPGEMIQTQPGDGEGDDRPHTDDQSDDGPAGPQPPRCWENN